MLYAPQEDCRCLGIVTTPKKTTHEVLILSFSNLELKHKNSLILSSSNLELKHKNSLILSSSNLELKHKL